MRTDAERLVFLKRMMKRERMKVASEMDNFRKIIQGKDHTIANQADIISTGQAHNKKMMESNEGLMKQINELKLELGQLRDDSTTLIDAANEESQRIAKCLDDVEEKNRSLQVQLNREKNDKLMITSALKSVTSVL